MPTARRRGADLRTWNAMHCCGRAFDDRAPDVAFLGRLLDDLVAAWPVDASRVGVAGHSNGAMMAYRLAAERSDVVTMVAAVAGAIGGEPSPGDPVRRIPDPGEPVAALLIHATDDERVPYAGGEGDPIGQARVDLSVDEAFAFWAEAAGAVPSEANRQDRADGVVVLEAVGGEGVVVRLLTTEGGHGWPGAARGLVQGPAQPDASEEIGVFLRAAPRPLPS